jgi:predicted metal-binding protein
MIGVQVSEVTMLSEMLARVAQEYVYARGKPFAGSDFANFVRHDLAIEAKKKLTFWPVELKVKASVGAGNWAAVPWLAFFDPLITESATLGFYVVYLINPQDREVTLSMNQGTTAVYKEFGRLKGREVLKRRAVDMAERLPDFSHRFSKAPIQLGSEDDLPLGYMAGHSFGRTYLLDELTKDAVGNDLMEMLAAYRALVDRGGTLPVEFMQEESGTKEIEETRRYILSRRIERSNKVRREVLAARKAVCECCGLDPVNDFGFRGPSLKTPLDVHHSAPLRHLAEGETKRYQVPNDFLVLCPTCHRMIHKQDDPSDLDALKQKMRFKLMRDVTYSLI